MNNLRKQARRLNLSNYHTDQIYYAHEHKHRIKDSELCLMYALDDGKAHSQKQICEDWHIPKTTINTIVKQWELKGYLELITIPGKRREMQIALTESGKYFVKGFLEIIYQAEEEALQKTLEQFPNYIDANEYYEKALKDAFNKKER